MSIKSEILKQSGMITRENYIKENSDTDFKLKKMEVKSRIDQMFRELAQEINSLQYMFKEYPIYPIDHMNKEKDVESLVQEKKRMEELKKEMGKLVNFKYKELKEFIDAVFEKEEVEVEDDDYEGEEND